MSLEATETTASDIVGPMLDSHPEVRPNAVIAENGTAPATKPTVEAQGSAEAIRDKAKEIFNADKHYADQFGRPQFTEGGYFRRIPLKKRLKRQAMKALGRSEEPEVSEPSESKEPKPSEPTTEAAPSAEASTVPEPEMKSHIPEPEAPKAPEGAADENRAAAKALCATIFTLGVSVGGVQCKPLPQHVESMETAWENYFRINGVKDVPPGVAVSLSTGGYLLFCYQSSRNIQEQGRGIRSWIVRKVGAWKTRRAAAAVAKNPQPTSAT